jgi:uncharacterized repeat protein (TIGR01451 family)
MKKTVYVVRLKIALFVLVVFSLQQTTLAGQSMQYGCPPQTLFDHQSNACVIVHDRRGEQIRSQPTIQVPNLSSLRKARQKGKTIPVPGGVGSGVRYVRGEFQVTNSANLDTEMIIYPDGLSQLVDTCEPSNNPPTDWMFTAATNRTEKGVEVVGIYWGEIIHDIGVFDWSCSLESPCCTQESPCPNGGATKHSASWVWNAPFTEYSCNYALIEDGKPEHLQLMMRYSNQTTKLDDGTPPLWENKVYFWNYCNDSFDLVYSHEYRADQKDCSLDNSCGSWGPIIETFFDCTQPPIEELGYNNTALFIDGSTTPGNLNGADTSWSGPPPEWRVMHRNPNDSWAVGAPGNLYVTASDDLDPIKVRNTVTYTIVVHNEGPAIADNVSVKAKLSRRFNFDEWSSPEQGSCSQSRRTTATCELGTLVPGQSVTTTLIGSYKRKRTERLTVTVDPDDVVSETNESDNIIIENTTVN